MRLSRMRWLPSWALALGIVLTGACRATGARDAEGVSVTSASAATAGSMAGAAHDAGTQCDNREPKAMMSPVGSDGGASICKDESKPTMPPASTIHPMPPTSGPGKMPPPDAIPPSPPDSDLPGGMSHAAAGADALPSRDAGTQSDASSEPQCVMGRGRCDAGMGVQGICTSPGDCGYCKDNDDCIQAYGDAFICSGVDVRICLLPI